jgi:hypothetical protein
MSTRSTHNQKLNTKTKGKSTKKNVKNYTRNKKQKHANQCKKQRTSIPSNTIRTTSP